MNYLSPTSLNMWMKSREDFYLRYLSPNRPRDAQSQPMAVGSAFDAYVKSFLYKELISKNEPEFDRDVLFEKQVEPQNRDWAKIEGAKAFMCYQKSGALSQLFAELSMASTTPRFEGKVEGMVDGVPVLGYLDLTFHSQAGMKVVLDWKVTGWCSDYPKSPYKGYLKIRDGYGEWVKGGHKDIQPYNVGGMVVDSAHPLEVVEPNWAAQLTIYSWLCGGEGPFIAAVDQILRNKPKNTVRIVEYRLQPTKAYEMMLKANLKEAWRCIESGHIFTELSYADSKNKCELLDKQSGIMVSTDPDDLLMMQMAK